MVYKELSKVRSDALDLFCFAEQTSCSCNPPLTREDSLNAIISNTVDITIDGKNPYSAFLINKEYALTTGDLARDLDNLHQEFGIVDHYREHKGQLCGYFPKTDVSLVKMIDNDDSPDRYLEVNIAKENTVTFNHGNEVLTIGINSENRILNVGAYILRDSADINFTKIGKKEDLIEVTALSFYGLPGGPVVDLKTGSVIGIYVGSSNNASYVSKIHNIAKDISCFAYQLVNKSNTDKHAV